MSQQLHSKFITVFNVSRVSHTAIQLFNNVANRSERVFGNHPNYVILLSDSYLEWRHT